MSLKFGIYLVEHKIISPEQFCGLVKIQQESLVSPAAVAIRKNMMTIRQVSEVLDQQELDSEKSFIEIAINSDYLDRADAEQLFQEQQKSSPSIRELVQQCGLLTGPQMAILFEHFLKSCQRTTPWSAKAPSDSENVKRTVEAPAVKSLPPRAPKYKQRPVIVSQYSTANVYE